MKLLLAIVILAVVALIGSRVTFYRDRLPMGFRLLLLTGTEYIVLGAILGRMGLGILDEATLAQLRPALLFGLCTAGYMFGLQFKVKQLATLPRNYFSITAIHAGVTILVAGGGVYLLLLRLIPMELPTMLLIATLLGSTACCTAQSALAIVAKNTRIQNRGLLELLRYISAVDGLFGVATFALAVSLFAGYRGGGLDPLSAAWAFASPLLAGIASAVIFLVVSNSRFSHREFSLFTVGTLMLCAGLADSFQASTLVSGLVFGVIAANVSRHRQRSMTVVIKGEKTIYIVVLVLAGATVVLHLDLSIVLMVGYMAARAVGKVTGGFAATRIFRPAYPVPAHVGLGLFSEGGLPVAMVMSFHAMTALPQAETLVAVTLVSVLVSELAGPALIGAVFREEEAAP